MSHIGKIGRLPAEIREELNRRLYGGEKGRRLLEWLNGLPESQHVLAAEFGGRPINHPNLTAWRTGGYQEWLVRQEALVQALDLPPQAKEPGEAGGRVTDHLATLLAARYAAALLDWDGETNDDMRRRLRVFDGLCQSVVRLRRGDQKGARLNLEQERLEWERQEAGNLSQFKVI